MQLGKLCKYAKNCPVYQNEIADLNKPIMIIRNVFCNRGIKGWTNCARFNALEEGKSVNQNSTPYKL
ncbi:MAG: hypothetical protein JXR61_02880 [Prolixibacteraceae bacterium]|nr:hypothetical protein [Prolixibacteraceae bacterium]